MPAGGPPGGRFHGRRGAVLHPCPSEACCAGERRGRKDDDHETRPYVDAATGGAVGPAAGSPERLCGDPYGPQRHGLARRRQALWPLPGRRGVVPVLGAGPARRGARAGGDAERRHQHGPGDCRGGGRGAIAPLCPAATTPSRACTSAAEHGPTTAPTGDPAPAATRTPSALSPPRARRSRCGWPMGTCGRERSETSCCICRCKGSVAIFM
jgi:hypothetical protein